MRYATSLIILILAASSPASMTAIFDAAEVYANGDPIIGMVAVRPIIDNTDSLVPLTNVRFRVNIHSGAETLWGFGGWSWNDETNPWYGARTGVLQLEPFALYGQGLSYFPPTQEWGPVITIWYSAGHALYVPVADPPPDLTEDELVDWDVMWEWDYNYVELHGIIPAGYIWDRPVRLMGDMELFSTAEGHLTADGVSMTLYDTDPGPQTVPEPLTVVVLGIGAVLLIARQKGRGVA